MPPKRTVRQAKLAEEQRERRLYVARRKDWAERHGCSEWEADRWMDSTPEQWAGRKRMAQAREAAGIELDVIDLEAIYD